MFINNTNHLCSDDTACSVLGTEQSCEMRCLAAQYTGTNPYNVNQGCTIYFQFITIINLYMFRAGLLLKTIYRVVPPDDKQ